MRNYGLASSAHSRIILPSQGQGNFSVVYHAHDFSESAHNGYEYYGLHVGQTDVLTFLATDNREMRGHFVDCRSGSSTFRHECELTFSGDPDRALVVSRGIAHIFDNLTGMVTLSQLRLYVDFANPDYKPGIDVINIDRGTAPLSFPEVRPNRFRAPNWICRAAIKVQRMRLRHGGEERHPFRFKVGKRTVVLTPIG